MFPEDWDQIWVIHETIYDILSLLNGWTLSTGCFLPWIKSPLDPKLLQGCFQHRALQRVDAQEHLLEAQVKLAPGMRTAASL